MTFVFWGLFVVLGIIVAGYYCWMLWIERHEVDDSRRPARPEES